MDTKKLKNFFLQQTVLLFIVSWVVLYFAQFFLQQSPPSRASIGLNFFLAALIVAFFRLQKKEHRRSEKALQKELEAFVSSGCHLPPQVSQSPWLSAMTLNIQKQLERERSQALLHLKKLQNVQKKFEKERILLEKQRELGAQKNKHLKQQLQNCFQFLFHLSHELRTPLNNVIGFTQYLLQESTMPQHLELLEIIERSGKVLLLLTKDLLDAAHEAAGKMRLYQQPFYLRSMIEELNDLLPAQAHSKGLHFAFVLSKELPTLVSGDSIRIQQILVNLINNAIKFTEKGEILCKVSLKKFCSSSQTASIFFEVHDTGTGIDPSKQIQVFEAFEHNNLPFSYGSGLGLYICKQLTQLMGGTISLKSQPNVGTTLSCLIPIKVLSFEPAASQLNGLEETLLLLVDIYQPLFDGIQQQCAFENVELIQTTRHHIKNDLLTFKKAIVIWFVDPADLIALDDLKANLKALKEANPHLKIILAAPLGLNAYCIESFLNLQLYGYIASPFSYEKLCKILLAGSRLQRLIQTPEHFLKNVLADQTILLIDDHPYHLRLMEIFLHQFGLQVFTCSGGKEALAKLKTLKPALIFMDVEMPSMHGLTLVKKIKALYPELAAVPVLALTAGQENLRKIVAKKNGFSEILTKPIELKTVEEILTKYLVEPRFIQVSDQLRRQEPQSQSEKSSPLPQENEQPLLLTSDLEYFDPALSLMRAANNQELNQLYRHAFQSEGNDLIMQLNHGAFPLSKSDHQSLYHALHRFYTTCAYNAAQRLTHTTKEFLALLQEPKVEGLDKKKFLQHSQKFIKILKKTFKVMKKNEQFNPNAPSPKKV